MENWNMILEIVGYIGTALVIVSMMMTSVTKLRLINICGGAISTVYAVLVGTYPVVVLNVCLISINIFQLIREARHKKLFTYLRVEAEDRSLGHFLSVYREDVARYFPAYELTAHENTEVHMIYIGAEPVGLLVGRREGNSLDVEIDYSVPKYRDLSVGKFLFSALKENGVEVLTSSVGAPEHKSYLRKMGFVEAGDTLRMQL